MFMLARMKFELGDFEKAKGMFLSCVNRSVLFAIRAENDPVFRGHRDVFQSWLSELREKELQKISKNVPSFDSKGVEAFWVQSQKFEGKLFAEAMEELSFLNELDSSASFARLRQWFNDYHMSHKRKMSMLMGDQMHRLRAHQSRYMKMLDDATTEADSPKVKNISEGRKNDENIFQKFASAMGKRERRKSVVTHTEDTAHRAKKDLREVEKWQQFIGEIDELVEICKKLQKPMYV